MHHPALPPGHHLVLVRVGEWMMKCSVLGSYVAVVSKPRTKVPWPSSVCAYVPMISSFWAMGSHLACCSGDPWDMSAGINICKMSCMIITIGYIHKIKCTRTGSCQAMYAEEVWDCMQLANCTRAPVGMPAQCQKCRQRALAGEV